MRSAGWPELLSLHRAGGFAAWPDVVGMLNGQCFAGARGGRWSSIHNGWPQQLELVAQQAPPRTSSCRCSLLPYGSHMGKEKRVGAAEQMEL